MKCYLSYILGLTLLLINIINARSIDNLIKTHRKKESGDKYYLIYVNNEHGEYKVFSDSKNQKRQDSKLFIESLVDEINDLIIDNKDTYENPEKLVEIEEASQQEKKKRNEEDPEYQTYDESSFVFPISSIKNSVVLYAYLSETLANELPSKFKNVIECSPDKATFKFTHQNYNVNEILAETHWKNVTVRENTGPHLSLISQGKFNKPSLDEYDDNYYYPSSAGKDVDLVFFDSSFNFNYYEFSNTDDRTVKCSGIVHNGKVSPSDNCAISSVYHGEFTTATAAGLNAGVANRANVYGIALLSDDENGPLNDSDIITGIQYIYENMIRQHKTVVNISLGGFNNREGIYYQHFRNLIQGITDKGGIVVVSAGNNGINFESYRQESGNENQYFVPCEFDSAICVGGINNMEKDFQKVYSLAGFSNFGKNVNIYAPSFIYVPVVKYNNANWELNSGTSFSSPIVAGMIATMISEESNVSYNMYSMLYKLKENGKNLTFNLPNGDTGILANNGKRIVYSSRANN